MGKIANALGKYAQERKAAGLSKLTRADWEALLAHNPKTGHLLNPDSTISDPGSHSLEGLRNSGTLQRLQDHKLIFPGGKLTPKGLAECERLKKKQGYNSGDTEDYKTKEKIIKDIDADDVIIELKDEVELPESSGVIEPAGKKVVPLLKRPTVVTAEPIDSAATSETPLIPPPAEENDIESIGTTIFSDHDDRDGAAHDTPINMLDRSGDRDSSLITTPQISFNRKKHHRSLVSITKPQSYEAEQFKMLRNNILFPAEGLAPQTILVTSCLPGEGKSFVSANLAVSIAMNVNKHVLLIDSDLRKPGLHRVYGFGDVPGLSNYLTDHRSLDSLLLKTSVEKLTLLPGGPIPPNPSELASSEQMSTLLEEVKHRYHDRLVVIDSPPPILAAETSFLAREVDGILIVVNHGKTPREDIEDLMDAVGSNKIIGVVINYLDMPLSRRYGYGKYGRYGVYGNGKK